MIIVTGTGRCGTGYISRVLTSVGVGCSHEGVFGLGGWEHACRAMKIRREQGGEPADSSWLAAPFLDRLEGATIVHLVRHPEHVVKSFMRIGFWRGSHLQYVGFAQRHLPEINDWETPEEKAVCFYLGWNEMIEPHANVFHRVEDDVRELLDKLGIDYEGKEIFEDRHYNRVGEEEPVLPEALIDGIMGRYGYEGRYQRDARSVY